MTYLQLLQRLHLLVRAGQENPGTAPDSVSGLTGLESEFAQYIQMAWHDIQRDQPGWLFMHKSALLTLPEGVSRIDPAPAIADYEAMILANSDNRGRFITIYGDSVSEETPVRYVPYQDWAYSYLNRGERGPSQPGYFTLRPDGQLEFDMTADRTYVLRIDYRRTPQDLTEDADVPIMPPQHHMLIVWWAICEYYCMTRDNSSELRAKSDFSRKRAMTKLRNEQLPEVLGFEVDP